MNRQGRKTKRSAARAEGHRLEKRVCNAVRQGFLTGEVHCGQWIEYQDINGLGYAQPDIFIVQDEVLHLLEVKRTQTTAGWEQMEDLYEPLLQHIYGLPVHKCLVCQNLRWVPSCTLDSVDEVGPEDSTLHFL